MCFLPWWQCGSGLTVDPFDDFRQPEPELAPDVAMRQGQQASIGSTLAGERVDFILLPACPSGEFFD